MSILKINAAQIGQSVTATNNFTLFQPTVPDGTVRLGVGNAGSTTTEIMNISNSGAVAIPGAVSVGSVSSTGTGANIIPVGTTAQRPSSPVNGMIRFNAETSSVENYDGSNWKGFGGATGSGGNEVFYENDTTITSSYTITTNKNAMTAGPVTITSGVSVTIPSGSVLTIV